MIPQNAITMATPRTKANVGLTLVILFLITLITGIILHLKAHGTIIQPRAVIKALGCGVTYGPIRLLAWNPVQKDVCGNETQGRMVPVRHLGDDSVHLPHGSERTRKIVVAGENTSSGVVALLVRNNHVCHHHRASFQGNPKLEPPQKNQTDKINLEVRNIIRNFANNNIAEICRR